MPADVPGTDEERPILQLWPTPSGLFYRIDGPGAEVLDVDLDGRRVFSFRAAPAGDVPDDVPAELRYSGHGPGDLRFEPWPPALRPRLQGTFRVQLRVSGAEDGPEATVSLDGGRGPLELVDHYGRPLVVNKWGRLGQAFADAAPGMVDRMLDHMTAIRELLESELGPVVYVTCGTLLGPVREGRLLPHDDDADLAYLSRHEHPADVALESFAVGRLLSAAGYEVVRLSVGHLQVVFSHEGRPDHYVDVFPGFVLGEHWLQHFMVRTPARREDLLPPSTVEVAGRQEPAPRDQELVLRAVYGEGWRTPDPAFAFRVPESTGERFYGWFADYNVEREQWDDLVLLAPPGEFGHDREPSAFARCVHERTPADSAVLELGSGVGTDALALASLGRTVRAYDFSRYAVAEARSRLAGADLPVTFEVQNLLDVRTVVRLGAELAAAPESWTVMGRRLLNAVEDRGRDNLFRLCWMLLRPSGRAFFDLVADHGYAGIPPYRHLAVEQVAAEAGRHRLVLEEVESRLEPLRWFGAAEEQIVPMYRLTFRRRPR
ncbi:class I SAM-dependent methyltransferase [Blastococcus montanus]|uniref:class I SAM-dependent methyltransferase n=1 Tax=Blastococcus montanus TaxID=3144973 RepID=UPI00320B69E0